MTPYCGVTRACAQGHTDSLRRERTGILRMTDYDDPIGIKGTQVLTLWTESTRKKEEGIIDRVWLVITI